MTSLPLLLAALAPLMMPPPLHDALVAARQHNHTLGISRAQLAIQEATTRQALAALLPNLALSGAYTRSQFATVLQYPTFSPTGQTSLESITVQPYNGLSATVTLNVPLINPTGIANYKATHHALDASGAAERASEGDVLLSTATAYYQVVAAQGIVESAERALGTAKESLAVAQSQHEAGTANQLTVDRAKVDVARAMQTWVTGKQTLGVARRSLETLTGAPLPASLPPPEDAEATRQSEEECTTAALRQRPELTQVQAMLEQQQAALTQAYLQFAPQLSVREWPHPTNAAGFVGHEAYWTAGVSLNWNIDPFGSTAAIARAQAAVQEQQERLEQQRNVVRDDVHTAWLALDADGARLGAATSEAESAREALTLAQAQFKLGTATSLDLSTAQRDAFTAEANLSQARADLAAALLALRKAAGESLLEDL